ncbi:hypothetical protein AB0C06_03555 [Micromonospora inaquosa]|uniref:Uncharacterized protein n=1 Tax=Micromonospora inaquosa TaxID=2203716 RepID=A0A3N9WQ88_9ACTN|nr:hypothetical protein [Micromonospora inaquosa]RQW97162.1 hypothetical protein DLJ59_29885 [Micromonospora inaquosa]
MDNDLMADNRVVMAIGKHELRLGLDSGGHWIVLSTKDGRHWTPAENIQSLLPLLEQRYEAVTTLRTDQASDPPPWDDLVRYALSCWSDYWAGLALGWLEDGYPAAPFRDTVRSLKDAPERTEIIRQRSLRLWCELTKP